MDERRKYGRVKTEGKVTVNVTDLLGNAEMAEVSAIDISPAGIAFICDKDMPHGAPIKLTLNLPGLYVEKDVPVVAKIVHSQKMEGKFKVGCCYVSKEGRKNT
ncbi:MAG: PilZ domain-containing protein [Candidatus Omnitrophica bacterium]|nr:PilZ domain-containing protein [Candidatus Omnitrophota bacterium]